MQNSFFSIVSILCVVCGWLSPLAVRAAPPVLHPPEKAAEAGAWKLTWECEPGATYRLERSYDMAHWTPVDTLTAVGGALTGTDAEAAGHGRAFWRVVRTDASSPVEFRITGIEPTGARDGWQITWASRQGAAYRLERSFDLRNWTPVGTIAAISDLTSMLDTRVVGRPKAFWRVVALDDGGGGAVVVSTPEAETPEPGGDAMWSVVVGGSEPVEKVVFVDENGDEVGEAAPGFGGTWSFALDRAPGDPPRIATLHAEVLGADGTRVESESRGILLADPGQFIPISDSGVLMPGKFVEVETDGTLGAFRYRPEGQVSPDRATGVHFDFPAGARLAGPTGGALEIRFVSGTFHRGGNVPPAAVGPAAQRSGGEHSLPLGDLLPADVQGAFGLPPGPVLLGWGSEWVKWTEGGLGPGGWGNLLVGLPFGDFSLPGTVLHAEVVADPQSGERSLVVRCHGEWRPLDAGPLFRIPKSAPLALRLSESGRFSAEGTAETEFANGGAVRGTIVWRDPNFEFRFEGKGVVIPALRRLGGILPADPPAAAPGAGATTAELDSFADFLAGCQNSIRGMAKAGDSQSPTGPALSPARPAAAAPSDPAGAALEAWAGRIASWSGDRAGQTLDDARLRDLAAVVAQSARLGEAAADLGTVLRLLENVLALAGPLESIRGVGDASDALAAAVNDAETRLLAAARRVAARQTLSAASGEIADAAAALAEIRKLVDALEPVSARAPVPARDAPTLRASFARLAADCQSALPTDIFAQFGIQQGDTTGADNASLATKNADDLLAFLAQVAGMFEVRRAASASPVPDIQSLNGATPPIYEAWRQILDVYPGREYELAWPAMLARDFDGIRMALARRARFLELNAKLGVPLASDDPALGAGIFSPIATRDIAAAFLAEQAKRPGAQLAESCGADIAALDTIVRSTTDAGLHSNIPETIHRASACLALLGRANGSAAECDPVYLALLEAGLHPDNPSPAQDTARTVRATGQYENASATSPITLQLNQAGRLVLGRIQFHGLSTRKTHCERIIGMLASETSDSAEFHILRREENDTLLGGNTVRPALLVVTRTQTGMNLEIRPLPGTPGAVVRFVKTTNIPSASSVLSDLFTGEAREIFLARQFAPLHSSQIAAVRAQAQHIADLVDAYLATAGQSTPVRNAGAARIAAGLEGVLAPVTLSQVPLARQIMREMLNRIDFAEGGERLSVWNWLRVIYSRHKDNPGFDFQTFRDFMGAEIDSQFSGNAFKYTIHIEEEENSIDIEDIISLGRVLLKIHIIKERTDGVGQPQTFELHGGLGQLSGGLSADWGIYEGGTGDDDITVYSNIDYTANMLAGPFGYFGATMAVGIGIIDVSYGPAMLNLYGDGTAPAFTIPLPVLDSDQHWVAPSVELGAGFGSLSAWDEMSPGDLSLSAEPEDMSFTDEASAAGAVQFDVDSAELRRCGYANLRMLVAEMRPVFENENSTVSILGFTDATADDAHNLALSQARAETAKAALLALVGEGLAIPPENIRAIGLGRRPAMGGTSPNESQLNSLEKEFLARKKAALPVLSDGEANPDWRSVTLILNNLVTIDLKTP